MKILTPKMYAASLLPANYLAALYGGLLTMAGSGNTAQDDFMGLSAPNDGITRYANGTALFSDATNQTASGAMPTIAADSDALLVNVARFNTGVDIRTAYGAATGGNEGISLFTDSAGTTIGHFKGATDLNLPSTAFSGTAPSDSDVLVSAMACDRSAGNYVYAYNLTTSAVITDVNNAGAMADTVTPVAICRLTGSLFASLVFTFASESLPATWKTDAVTIAQSIYAAKGDTGI